MNRCMNITVLDGHVHPIVCTETSLCMVQQTSDKECAVHRGDHRKRASATEEHYTDHYRERHGWTASSGLGSRAAYKSHSLFVERPFSLKGFFGISENLHKREYAVVAGEINLHHFSRDETPQQSCTLSLLSDTRRYPIIVPAYLAVVLLCIFQNAPLIPNPNRAGFLALAQFPIVFLFATKHFILSLLLGPGNGYEKLNYIRRVAGRLMFLERNLWRSNLFRAWNHRLDPASPSKKAFSIRLSTSSSESQLASTYDERLSLTTPTYIHSVLTFVAFFVTVRYHTLYAEPWIFPALAFFGADALLQFFCYRIKDAKPSAPDQLMTRVFESRPFTILSAPPSKSCFNLSGMILAARVNGDWTSELNTYTPDKQDLADPVSEKQSGDERSGVPVHVMIDGPYGGSSVDLGQYETVLLVAGGSGATFTLGLLDDIVYRCVKAGRPDGERTKRIEFVWCIKSFGHIAWFSQMLADIGNLAADLITCLCDPEAVPFIPNCNVKLERPSVYILLRETTGLSQPPSLESQEAYSHMAEVASQCVRADRRALSWKLGMQSRDWVLETL
ncbi:hypothetical protein PISMIDRAFT_16241 [Pisolithus microcarpus 441]|uniref:Ferric reductase NAD binding domain-containing protein n=1 Tax=Pisolithus microcarpus 441 TaxID=765257 RepID=A0A0C9YGU6_9AGAM|nr:iron reductase [Pisolithus microcarpus]KIK15856.1 hypothetical protein PISMIDRAFT_16241 [Pisolithus microcarpus 441]